MFDFLKYEGFITNKNKEELLLIKDELLEDIETLEKDLNEDHINAKIFNSDYTPSGLIVLEKLKLKKYCLSIVNKKLNEYNN